jgi:anti-sigma factor RsiW
MTDHERLAPLAPGYVRAELGAQERAAFESHLERCERCREEVGLLRVRERVMAIVRRGAGPPESP